MSMATSNEDLIAYILLNLHFTTPGYHYKIYKSHADVAELVDALASGASARKGVEVQVLLSAPK